MMFLIVLMMFLVWNLEHPVINMVCCFSLFFLAATVCYSARRPIRLTRKVFSPFVTWLSQRFIFFSAFVNVAAATISVFRLILDLCSILSHVLYLDFT